MSARRDADCRRHAAGLVALAGQREEVPGRTAVLDHLGRCSRCATELQELALTAIALRRLGVEPVAAVDPQSSWRRLRARIEQSRAGAAAVAWRWRTTLGGLAAGTLVVAALVAPLALDIRLAANGAEPTGYRQAEPDILGLRIEASYIAAAQSRVLTPLEKAAETVTVLPRRYPDQFFSEVKEVLSRPIGHPPAVR